MKLYHPQDELTFGMYKGHSLAEIYQYVPSYIEWLIEYVSDFILETSEFEQLPKPTPYAGIMWSDKTSEVNYRISGSDAIKIAKEANAKSKMEIDFTFSEKLRDILDQKRKGEYTTPNWEANKRGREGYTTFDLATK